MRAESRRDVLELKQTSSNRAHRRRLAGQGGQERQGVVPSQQRPGQRHSCDDLAHALGLSVVREADDEGQRHVGQAPATAASGSTPRDTADSARTWAHMVVSMQGGDGQPNQAWDR